MISQETKDYYNLTNCDEFVKSLPNGYDTVIGENGIILSNKPDEVPFSLSVYMTR